MTAGAAVAVTIHRPAVRESCVVRAVDRDASHFSAVIVTRGRVVRPPHAIGCLVRDTRLMSAHSPRVIEVNQLKTSDHGVDFGGKAVKMSVLSHDS